MSNEFNKDYCDLQHKNLSESWARMEEKVDKILEKLDKFSELVQNHEFRIKILETETKKDDKKININWALVFKILTIAFGSLLAALGTYLGVS
jgi:hypothetical protein